LVAPMKMTDPQSRSHTNRNIAKPKYNQSNVRGYDKISAGAALIEQQGLQLPKPQKGSKMLTSESDIAKQTKGVAEALMRYAKAAKSGDGKSLIESSRDIYKLCRPLANKVRSMIEQAPDKDTRDRLISIHGSLSNYPTQIKIMSGVKATLDKSDFDKGDQLVSMVEALSSAVLAVIPTVNTFILTQ